ncbi:MAG TPA: hypothetical protein VLL97_14660, partial [Acidobacteriota bacterium]|nr:hypothetical protein [Acidobacteriota bacterium]
AQNAVPYLDYVFDSAVKKHGPLNDPKKKVHVMNTVLPYLVKLPSAVERSDYVFHFARRLEIDDQQLLAEAKRAAQQRRGRLAEEPVTSAISMKTAEKKLLQLLLSHTGLQDRILPICSRQDFEGLTSEKLFSAIMDEFEKNRLSTYGSLHRHFAGAPEQALLAQMEIEEVPEDPTPGTAESFLNALRTVRLATYRQQIQKKIAEASERNDDEMLDHLIEQRVLVDRELVSLSRK